MKSSKPYRYLPVVFLLGFQSFSACAENDFWQSLSAGKVSGSFRLRSESVDDSVNKNAHGVTLRSRLAYSSEPFYGFSGTLEFDNTSVIAGQENYAPETAGFATIADPRVTEMNQALIRYKADYGLNMALGRQRIVWDNQRFVGAVGWRQDDQTFDAVSAAYNYKKFSLNYAYVDKVNGITPAFDADVSHHLLNASYNWMPALQSTVYMYRLHDNQQFNDPAKDNETAGLRLNGSIDAGKITLRYAAEFARQSALDFDVNYGLAELGLSVSHYKVAVGMEWLGSDAGNYAFQTPLATKHAFNGWADKFLTTPANGLRDSYISAGFAMAGVTLLLAYHDFDADEGGADYGEEIDAMASYRVNKNLNLGVKYAAYQADSFSSDTDKVWLWSELTF